MKQCDVTDDQRESASPECEDFGTFNSVEVVSGGGDISGHKATEQLLSNVIVEGTEAKFQLDTAASGCLMSQKLFRKLQWKSRRRGGSLQVCNEKTSVRLADGSISNKPSKSVWLSVKPQHRARPVRVKFFIVSGGANLLGRWAIRQLWPSQFDSFKRAVCMSSVVQEDKCGDQCMATLDSASDAGSSFSSVAASVAELSSKIVHLETIVCDMSRHVGAKIEQSDTSGLDSQFEISKECTFNKESLDTESVVFGDFR